MTWKSKLIAGRSTVAPASAGDRAALARATAPCLPGFSHRRLKPAPLERHLVRLPRVAFGSSELRLTALGFSRRSSSAGTLNSTLFTRLFGSPAEEIGR